MSSILHSISAYMEKPVVFLLLLIIIITALLAGQLIGEYFSEHRQMKVALPKLLEELKKNRGKTGQVISKAGLLPRQKDRLLEITRHPDYSDFMRESLAVRLIKEEQDCYDRRLLPSDLIAKIAPMLGMLGTLIPLGPGIIALGQGDTQTLSVSLLTAFDTTVAGLLCAGAATVISSIRRLWYRNYMSLFETLMENILELERGEKQ